MGIGGGGVDCAASLLESGAAGPCAVDVGVQDEKEEDPVCAVLVGCTF